MFKKILAVLTAVTLAVSSFHSVSLAAETRKIQEGDTIAVNALSDLQAGSYELDAQLSSKANVITGDVEFGADLLTGTTLNVAKDGTANLTLSFGTGSVVILGNTAATFVSETYFYSGADHQGYFGIKDNGAWQTASYTLSSEASVTGNSASGNVASKYVTSMTVPVSSVSGTYDLALAVNSTMMGMQFGGADATYPATLTVDWSKVKVTNLVKEQYTINVTANDSEAGTVSGNGTVTEGTQTKVTATANAGYTFKHWTENGAEVSTAAEYTFTVNSSRNLVAVFEAQKIGTSNKNEGNNQENGTDTGEKISVSDLFELKAGTYGLDSTLSCYVSAMGGVEFGKPLLSRAVLTVAEDGTATATLHFQTSTVTIYSVTANTYISTEGKTQYWDGSAWVNATYTTDENGYVKTMTFPIKKAEATYQLGLMVGSDVMSTQFGGTDSKYKATWTVDWSNVTVGEVAGSKEETSTDGSTNNSTTNGTSGSTSNTTSTSDGTSASGSTSTSSGAGSSNSKKNASSTSASTTGTVMSVSSLSELEAGSYGLSASLSCYVNAMGGVEFGAPLLSGAVLNVAKDGTATITLSFRTSSVTIYGVTADTYVSAEGKVQYWNGSAWVDASYTTDANGYVKTMTFPITKTSSTYKLALMIGSNVMGTQFGGSDSKYAATLTVNWDKVTVGGSGTPQTGDTLPILPLVAGLFSMVVIVAILQEKKRSNGNFS